MRWTLRNYIYFLCCVVRYYFCQLLGIKRIVAEPVNPVDTYITDRKHKFVNATESTNIDPAFYDKTKYAEITRDNNHLETLWKTRLMYEPTPRGSLIMFYDVFRQGFAYYCDTNCVPYSVLNAAAMKYVGVFYCRDFFFDEDGKSPLYPIYYPEEKKEVRTVANSAQFAKMRNYKLEKEQVVQKTAIKNKFIYLGKISNLAILQKKKVVRGGFATQYDAMFAKQGTAAPERVSYKDFKAGQGTYGSAFLNATRSYAPTAQGADAGYAGTPATPPFIKQSPPVPDEIILSHKAGGCRPPATPRSREEDGTEVPAHNAIILSHKAFC